MLRAERTSVWRRDYKFTQDGAPVSTFSSHWWRSGGQIQVEGREYRIVSTVWGRTYTMTDSAGTVVATAERAGRKHWTVTADGRSYRFRRASVWSSEQHLVEGDRTAGTIRKSSWWRGGAEATLPGLSLPAQLFVVAVVLSVWEQQNAAAASSGGG